MSNNPFEVLSEVYNETTKQIDEKQCTSVLYKSTFEKISDFLTTVNYHLKDIEYLDGYFIFSHGTNSVIHFRIKECPCWKFGIWWSIKNKEESFEDNAITHKILKGEFFCMHERYLDKFKPTRSSYLCEIEFKLNEDTTLCYDKIDKYDLYDAVSIIEFIHEHPYLAYYKDVHGINYNYHYQSHIKSFLEYYLDGFVVAKDNFINKVFNYIEYNYIITFMKDLFKDYTWLIHDCGNDISPRYDPVVFLSSNEAEDIGVEFSKCYNLFLNNRYYENEYHKFISKLKNIAKIFGGYPYGNVSTSVEIMDINELEQYKKDYFSNDKIYNME